MKIKIFLRLAVTAGLCFLAACNSDSDSIYGGGPGDASYMEPDPQDLCITTDCGSREVLVRVPEAENLVFTPDGRLFVSGIELFEIIKHEDGNFEAVIIPMDGEHSASLGGLAVRNGLLYLNDESQRGLWVGRLDDPNMTMRKIHTWAGEVTANGLDFGPDGALYCTNGPQPDLEEFRTLSRVHLDPADPFTVLNEEPVFTFPEIPAANGLVVKGNTFYMVAYLSGLEVGSVLAFEVEQDGTVGPTRRVAGSTVSTFDDLEVIGDRILVTNHFLRSILMFDLEGNQLADSGPLFDSPTALTWGRPPMFEPTDLLIAERGLLGEPSSDYGNVLSVFRPIAR